MSHKTLNDILIELDTQQRQELVELSRSVDPGEIERKRNARKQLANVAVFFIERSWETIAPEVEAFSLEVEARKTPEELQAYLRSLSAREPAFAWGWTRARMDARLMQLLERCVPALLQQHSEQAALYRDCLHQVDHYWFRESPLHHLKAGYHTALAVACKWYGTVYELQRESAEGGPHAEPDFSAELRQFASFSLTMLTRTDRYLWDSAGADPMDAILQEGTLKIAPRSIPKLDLKNAPDYGIRLGCPALRARRREGASVFSGVNEWVEQVFARYLSQKEE